ncbi:hypothetical protein WH96_19405 [Kiloniella spongiae]|uniref:Uncharacterized protein n=1 Tax=Kiloniella spongiae TaxID=1489064 RepID=A0A0H2MAD1_9PROT|nr:hypothetical protein [Kiloniella spongiae]KLN59136.1 hypothetical protein WH96_19405 [Kiloniella spongiae]
MATTLKGSRALLHALDAVTAMEQARQKIKLSGQKTPDKVSGGRNIKDVGAVELFEFLSEGIKN